MECGSVLPHRVPEHVEIPEHGMRPLIPEVEFGQIMTD
jgi:hypothetical protein